MKTETALEITTRRPLRPTLLVIAKGAHCNPASLAQDVAQALAADMQRLTRTFSQRSWNVPALDIDDPAFLAEAWTGMEQTNMAVAAGYDGAPAQREKIAQIISATNALPTLVCAGPAPAGIELFAKSVSTLPGIRKNQCDLVISALRDARQENTWEPWNPAALRTETRPPRPH